MQKSTERIIDSLTEGDDFKVQALNVLLTYIAHLRTVKGATFGEIHSALSLVYSDFAKGAQDTQNTHL